LSIFETEQAANYRQRHKLSGKCVEFARGSLGGPPARIESWSYAFDRVDEEQGEADAAEETAIHRMRRFRSMRGDPWVKRLVALALLGYFAFYLAASAGPLEHRDPACLTVPTVVRPRC
jgi:hypothetical protein